MEKYGKVPTKNDKGQVAIKRVRQNDKMIRLPSGKVYNFVFRNGICFAWVDEEDVQTVLDTKRHCCAGKQVQQFYLAREMDVGTWR